VLLLALLALIATGVGLGFANDLENVKRELKESLSDYNPTSRRDTDKDLVNAWDELQEEVEIIFYYIDF